MAEETKKTEERKIEEKQKEKKTAEYKEKKNEAIVNGKNLSISTKYAAALCGFIRGKEIDNAISSLEDVIRFKRAVPMKGEIAHKKGMMSGRYPIKGSKIFIMLLKSLKSNAISNELELEKFKIACVANLASKPYKRFGQGRIKRSHVMIKLIPIKFLKKSLNKNRKEK